jgi:hypothetical protein
MTAKQVVGRLEGDITQDVPDNNLPVVADQPLPASALMQLAIQRMDGQNAPAMVEALEKLVGLHERIEAKNAVKAFNKAMAQFQAECPQILKDSVGKIVTDKGQFSYKYAELDQIDDAIRPLKTRLGFSNRFVVEAIDKRVKVTCIVSHVGGHSIESPFECSTESKAGMSDAQKSGAAVTFAKRYALIAAYGLTTTETDTDAQQRVDRKPEKITSEQAAQLSALIEETKSDMGKFLGFFDVDAVADLTTAQFPRAAQMLESKRAK